MDINFHYFAIKSLAVQAGFSPADAQILAEYSQFVDDYNRTGSILFQHVPEFARHLAKKEGSRWRMHCVTTGFSSFIDMAELIRRSRQKYICIPFHFVPPQALNVPVTDSAAWRTEPETLSKPTVLRTLLGKAEDRYKQAPAARESLIGLGIVLHIFADTYAHQGFSGFGGWWNHGSVIKEQCNTGKRLRLVSSAIKRLGHNAANDKRVVPSIFVGHMSFGHAPDKSSLCFTARQKKAPGRKLELEYTRDNTQVFLDASRNIFNFMRRCRALPLASESEWAPVSAAMRQGFLTQESDVKLLAAHWQKYFPDIAYEYGLGKVLKRSLRVTDTSDGGQKGAMSVTPAEEKALERLFTPTPPEAEAVGKDMRAAAQAETVVRAITDDFFWFNVFAKEIRDAVNGVVTPLKIT